MHKIHSVGVQFGPLTLPTEQEVREAVYENRWLDDFAVTVSGVIDMTPTLGSSFPPDTHTWDVDVLCTEDHHNRQQCHWIDSVFWRAGNLIVLRWEQTHHTSMGTLVELLTLSPTITPEKGRPSWQQS